MKTKFMAKPSRYVLFAKWIYNAVLKQSPKSWGGDDHVDDIV